MGTPFIACNLEKSLIGYLRINKYYMSDYSSQYLGKVVTVKIDRALNTTHPKHGFVYEANYGFIPDTEAPDGEELDAYVLGVNVPIETFTGKCIAIIHRTNDDDDKLVVVPPEVENLTDEEINKATHFQEQWFQHVIIRP